MHVCKPDHHDGGIKSYLFIYLINTAHYPQIYTISCAKAYTTLVQCIIRAAIQSIKLLKLHVKSV